jgi:hypothetical protein
MSGRQTVKGRRVLARMRLRFNRFVTILGLIDIKGG